MKKPICLEKAIYKNKEQLIKALPHIAGTRKPRSRPRSEEESIGLTIATAELVKDAFKSGRIIKKSPKGFVINEFKKRTY